MKLNIYSTYDKVAKIWSTPTYAANDEVYQRNLKGLITSGNANTVAIIRDSDFWCIGSFDDETGVLTVSCGSRLVFTGVSLLQKDGE